MRTKKLFQIIGLLLCSLFYLNVHAQSDGKLVQLEKSFCKVYVPIYAKDYIYEIDSCKCQKGLFSGEATISVYQQTIEEYSDYYLEIPVSDTTTTLVYQLTGNFVNGYLEGEGTYVTREAYDDDEEVYDTKELKCNFVHGEFAQDGVRTSFLRDGDTIKSTGQFLNAKMYGEGTTYYSLSNIIEKGIFVDDNLYDGVVGENIETTDFMYYWKGEQYNEIPAGFNSYPETGKPFTAYFDKSFELCAKENATYYWTGIYSKPHVCRDTLTLRYCSNNQIAAKLAVRFVDYENLKNCYFEGEQSFFYPDSSLKQQGHMINNCINDIRIYDEHGKIRLAGRLLFDMVVMRIYEDSTRGSYMLCDKNNVINADSYYQNGKTLESVSHSSSMYNSKVLNQYVSLFSFKSDESLEPDEFTSDYRHFIVDDEKSLFDEQSVYEAELAILEHHKKHLFGIVLKGYEDDYYAFLIQDNQVEFGQYKSNGKLIKSYYKETYDGFITDTVLLKVTKQDDLHYFYINDSLVYEKSFDYYNHLLLVHGVKSDVKVLDCSHRVVAEEDDADSQATEEVLDLIKKMLEYDFVKDSVEDIKCFEGLGTGFFLHQDGYILTNYHVISNASCVVIETELFTGKNKDFEVDVVLVDKKNDLAIVKIKDTTYHLSAPIPYIIDTSEIELGEPVFALGFPFVQSMGKTIKYTNGVINCLTGYQNGDNLYQTSATTQPGNSGSPVFNDRGDVIGIAVSILNRMKYENVNYCVKAKYIMQMIHYLPEELDFSQNIPLEQVSKTQMIKKFAPYTVLVKVRP